MKNNKAKEDWIECSFEDLLDYVQPTKYIVESTKYSDEYKTPVLTAGKSFIKGYTNETEGIFDNLPTIIFDDFTTATQFVNFKFKVKSSAMKILVPTSKLVNMTFAYHYMQVHQVRSDTHKRYWISVYAKMKILLPSLAEQRAIVAKIEELFSSLDSGIADLKKAQDQLKIYRQAVLKKAFETYKTSSKSIKDVVEKVQIGPFGSQLHKADYIIDGIPLINPMHIQEGKINPNPNYTISIEKRDSLPNYILQQGDVIMGRRGEMGRSALVTKNEIGWFCGTGSLYLRPNLSLLSPSYLNIYIQSATVKELLTGSATGTTMMNLNKKIILTLPIPIPSLKEQHLIVQEIERCLSVCDKVEESIVESLEKSNALRQSILKKAFEGKLLNAQELTACKSASDYEPASVLLKKIKAEKKK